MCDNCQLHVLAFNLFPAARFWTNNFNPYTVASVTCKKPNNASVRHIFTTAFVTNEATFDGYLKP
jgi:hypothetical protein